MTAAALISAGRFAEAPDALEAALLDCRDPRQMLATIEIARRAALAARAAAVDELLRARSRRKMLSRY